MLSMYDVTLKTASDATKRAPAPAAMTATRFQPSLSLGNLESILKPSQKCNEMTMGVPNSLEVDVIIGFGSLSDRVNTD
jgi:hypothetical protein